MNAVSCLSHTSLDPVYDSASSTFFSGVDSPAKILSQITYSPFLGKFLITFTAARNFSSVVISVVRNTNHLSRHSPAEQHNTPLAQQLQDWNKRTSRHVM